MTLNDDDISRLLPRTGLAAPSLSELASLSASQRAQRQAGSLDAIRAWMLSTLATRFGSASAMWPAAQVKAVIDFDPTLIAGVVKQVGPTDVPRIDPVTGAYGSTNPVLLSTTVRGSDVIAWVNALALPYAGFRGAVLRGFIDDSLSQGTLDLVTSAADTLFAQFAGQFGSDWWPTQTMVDVFSEAILAGSRWQWNWALDRSVGAAPPTFIADSRTGGVGNLRTSDYGTTFLYAPDVIAFYGKWMAYAQTNVGAAS